jgi:hypothetical protein
MINTEKVGRMNFIMKLQEQWKICSAAVALLTAEDAVILCAFVEVLELRTVGRRCQETQQSVCERKMLI